MDTARVLGKRILLADDEQGAREAIKCLLKVDDHEVTEADNGAAALDLFGPDRFDLVITDFNMPRMKGNELASRIKRTSPTQPILMITAYALRLGDPENPVDAILLKPFNFSELRRTISKLVS